MTIPVTALSPEGREVVVEDPLADVHPLFARAIAQHFPHLRQTVEGACPECSGTGRRCDHPCQCQKESKAMTKEARVAELKARIEEAAAREKEALMDKSRAEAKLAAAEGREWDREYHESFVAAQTHQPGGHEWFWSHVAARDAQRIVAGEAKLEDFAPYERPRIMAEVERLRAEAQGH